MVERKGTKELIADSFMELSTQRQMHHITMSDIADNCGISRRTIYYHFEDKFAIMDWIYERQLVERMDLWLENGDYYLVLEHSCKLMDEISDYVKGINEKMLVVLSPVERMTQRSLGIFLDYIARRHGEGALDERALFELEAYNRLCIDAIFRWIEAGKRQSAEQFAGWLFACMPEDVKSVLA